MSGLALLAHRLGATVTGSDRAESSYLERLRAGGLTPRVGHDADAVPPDAEVVVSTAIPADNPRLEGDAVDYWDFGRHLIVSNTSWETTRP